MPRACVSERLDLYVFDGHKVHFQDVIMGLSKEAMLRVGKT